MGVLEQFWVFLMLQTVSRYLFEWFCGTLLEFLTVPAQLIRMPRSPTKSKKQQITNTAEWQPNSIVTIGPGASAIVGQVLRFETRFLCTQPPKVGFLEAFFNAKTRFLQKSVGLVVGFSSVRPQKNPIFLRLKRTTLELALIQILASTLQNSASYSSGWVKRGSVLKKRSLPNPPFQFPFFLRRRRFIIYVNKTVRHWWNSNFRFPFFCDDFTLLFFPISLFCNAHILL